MLTKSHRLLLFKKKILLSWIFLLLSKLLAIAPQPQLRFIQDLTGCCPCSTNEKIKTFSSPDSEEKSEARNLLNPAVGISGKPQNVLRPKASST